MNTFHDWIYTKTILFFSRSTSTEKKENKEKYNVSYEILLSRHMIFVQEI